MKVAAYQAPIGATRSMDALGLLGEQADRCEALGVKILCCPEGVLGGLADYATEPSKIAIDVAGGQLQALLAPLANKRIATILGFTELGPEGRLYNSAAVFHRGTVLGVYRKLHPAIRRSVYSAGEERPVFQVGSLTFGIVLCYDSTFAEPARAMAAKGATALFVPTNNGLPLGRAGPELIAEARSCDIARARENDVWVIRADVAGRTKSLESYGSSGIVDPEGQVLQTSRQLEADLLVEEIGSVPRGVEKRRAREAEESNPAKPGHRHISGSEEHPAGLDRGEDGEPD